MTVQVEERTEGKVLAVDVTGQLDKQDYEQFGPQVDRMIQQHGKIRVLLEAHDFHGWDAGRCGKTSSSMPVTSTTSNGSRLSAKRNGKKEWRLSANRSRRRKFASSKKNKLIKPASGSKPSNRNRLILSLRPGPTVWHAGQVAWRAGCRAWL